LKSYNQQTAKRIKKLKHEIAAIKSRYKAGSARQSNLEKKQEEINALIQDADNRKEGLKKELVALNEYRQSIAQSQDRVKVAKLGREIDALRKGIAALDTSSQQMAKLSSSLIVRK
jgi:chromosome segregation ATPase